jgi:putative phage-type endonuclease
MIFMFEERSDSWLTFRKDYISATEVGSLVGVNSYLTANQLMKQKNSTTIDRVDNRHIRDGLISEAATFKALELLGWKLDNLSPKGQVLVFTDEDRKLSSTPDNFRWDIPSVVEVKKTTRENFEKNWMGSCPPLRYLAQVQAQMHTTGFKRGFLACIALEDDIPVSIYDVRYSPEFIYLIDEALVKFRAATSGSRFIIREAVKQQAVDALSRSYDYLGVFRHGTGSELSLEELFK